ncbi:MAG: hypothetical protein DHS20C18_35180 [Saprospiraceae bacterium]|nr:MAG: hypothetical protein DHS20C18_35180 [Saprospiraceae bacterium]
MKKQKGILEELEKVGIDLLLEEPFFAHLLAGVNRKIDETLTPTIQLIFEQGSFCLRINPQYWQRDIPNRDHRIGALKHELLHLIFRHSLKTSDYENAFLFDLAADLTANQYLTDKQLPETAISPKKWPGAVPETLAEIEAFYLALHQLALQIPNHPWLTTIQKNKSLIFAGHQSWYQQQTQAERELLELAIGQLISRALLRTKSHDLQQLPSTLHPWLLREAANGRGRLHWRRIIRLFAASSSRTQVKNTIKRPSRRYGTTPGIKIRRHHQLIVALDTSGSIDAKEMALFFKEVNQMWRLGTEILLVECDDAIRSIQQYKGQVPLHRKGLGGTDFTPVIELANERPEYDALLYFTDGQGPVPEIVCRLPILWIITGGGIHSDQLIYQKLPGQKVKLPG